MGDVAQVLGHYLSWFGLSESQIHIIYTAEYRNHNHKNCEAVIENFSKNSNGRDKIWLSRRQSMIKFRYASKSPADKDYKLQ